MTEKHEFGAVPINKCFNDLYGIRIIFNENIDHNKIKSFIENKYKEKLKCIDSSKEEGYVATHVYFKNNNYSFLWELQIWDKSHECGKDVSVSTHFVQTDSKSWTSVVEKDYFFRDVEVLESIEEFIKLIKTFSL